MNFNDLNNTTPNNLNVPNTTLLDTIHVERGIIPANLCDFIVQDTEKREWKPHTWYNNQQDTYGSEETMELDVQPSTCLLYTSPSPRDLSTSRMPSSA